MSSRLSYTSSPESDLDISMDNNNRSSSFREADSQADRRLVKSSSDPSIVAAEELADGKKFSQYPTYSLGRNAAQVCYSIFKDLFIASLIWFSLQIFLLFLNNLH